MLLRALLPALICLALLPAQAADITVSAAASLGNAFQQIARLYEAQYPDAKVALNLGASGALLQQIAKGAPVDVFASADQETMDQAQQLQLVTAKARHDFCTNQLVVVTPADSKLPLQQLTDLAKPAVQRIAIGLPTTVPAGRYARRALDVAQLWPAIAARVIPAQNVRQALDYVARGEVDAGFVYATDALLLKDKVRVAFTVRLDQAIRYPIAPLNTSAHAAEARRFVAYVRSPAGQAVLAQHGFMKP
ncbi:molybdate ABC transporter substrate-binding protein [Chitinimonas sp. BJYL2]|uniref:molybdate ABC transporter substrate-binding protein n=1 Tax=Chitinimonas sp. BJYL2 TaxID=2976696 RepID=UPI0022B2F00A|nr:molybdate ABC transporter substrate-binding protein [Chitinimonas sp. BJYL2]